MSWIRLRQIALVVHDLEPVVAALGSTLGLEVAHRDPAVAAFGLHNAVLPLGTQFVEVVSPTRPGTAGGRQLERLGGDGGYMVIGHIGPNEADHDELRRRVDDLGVRVALENTLDEPGHDGYRILQLHPADTGGSFLEIDFQPGGEDPTGPWMPAGEGWQQAIRTDVVSAITGVELCVPDPDAVAERWSAITALPVTDRTIQLDNAAVVFTEGRGGLVAVDCVGPADGNGNGQDTATHRIGGVDFRVHAA